MIAITHDPFYLKMAAGFALFSISILVLDLSRATRTRDVIGRAGPNDALDASRKAKPSAAPAPPSRQGGQGTGRPPSDNNNRQE